MARSSARSAITGKTEAHFARWSATIAAALAIAPLWAGGLSLYKIAFRSDADVKVQALICESSAITLAVTNTGRHAGILGNSSVTLQVNGKPAGKPIRLQPAEQHSVVQPEEAFALKFEPRVEGVAASLPTPFGANACEYSVATAIRDFDGDPHDVIVSCPCPAPAANP